MNCEIDFCSKQRVFNCEECKEDLLEYSYCIVHAKQHKEINPSHTLTRVCIKIDELTSMILLNSFQDLVTKAQSARAFILKYVNAFLNKTLDHANYSLAELHYSEKKYNDAIRLLESGNYIDIMSITETELLITKFMNDENESQMEIRKIEKTKEFIDKIIFKEENIKQMTEKLNKIRADIDCYTVFKETILEKHNIKEFIRKQNPPLIHYFDNDSGKFVCTNALDGAIKFISINDIKHKLAATSCCCYIDNETLFIDGGVPNQTKYSFGSPTRYEYYLINLKSNKASIICSENWAEGKGCCYYNSTIYTLGGQFYNTFESYNILNHKFSQLTSLPEACSYISCQGLQNKLHFAGYNSRYIKTYDIEKKLFRSGFYLSENTFKLILYADCVFFIIESGKVYKYDIGSFSYDLVNQGSMLNQSFLIAPPIFYRNCFYFVQSDKTLWALNIKNYKLNQIGESGQI